MADEQARQPEKYDLVVNKVHKAWATATISGKEIRDLAGSPASYVVNQIVSGPDADPEIGDEQRVELNHQAEPKGIKRFMTRKPDTTPGA